MRKHRKLPFTLLFSMIVGILLTISIGLSIWLITDRVIIKPNLAVDKIITQYLSGQSATYQENTIWLPDSDVLGWTYESEELVYLFKLIEDSNGNPQPESGYITVTDKVGPINAGKYKIKVMYLDENLEQNDEKNYAEVEFVIHKATVDMTGITFDNKVETYSRQEYKMEVTGTLPKQIEKVVYTCGTEEFKGATDATTAPIEVVASFILKDNKNYEPIPSMTATLTINKLDISELTITFPTHLDNKFYYTGQSLQEQLNEIAVMHGNHELTSNEVTVSFSEVTALGTGHYATVIGKGNYTGEATINYSIVKDKLVIEVSQNPTIYLDGDYFFEFSGGQISFDGYITVSDSQGNPVDIKDVDISYKFNEVGKTEYTSGLPKDCSSYWIEIIAKHQDYEDGVKKIRVDINPIDLSKGDGTITLESADLIYNGEQHKPTILEVKHNGKVLERGVDYEVNAQSWFNNINATVADTSDDNSKKARLTISGIGNYRNGLTTYFTIDPAPITITVPVYTTSKVVDGLNVIVEGQTDNLTVKTAGYAVSDGKRLEAGLASDLATIAFPTKDTEAVMNVNVTYRYNQSQNSNGVYNYQNVTATKTFKMYAVAKIGTTFYGTITKALNKATSKQTVWVLPDIYESTGYYPMIRDNAVVEDSVTLALTYASSDFTTGYKIFANEEDLVADSSTGNAAKAKIASSGSLTVNSGGTLTVGAYVGGEGAVGTHHAVLMNDGVINIGNNGTANAYGYIKGTGTFNVNPGSKVHDILRIYDFAGTRYAAGMYYKNYSSGEMNNIMPFQSYSFHNISCKLKIFKGANYYTRYQINISNTIHANEIIMFGDDGMFELTTDVDQLRTKGYVERIINNTIGTTNINGDFTTTNQDIYQREVYDFYSSVEDNSISVKMSLDALVTKINLNIVTSANLAMPIGLMDITLKSGYTFNIKVNSFKFLPGSRVTIEEGATLNQNKDINVIFYEKYYDNFTQVPSSGSPKKPADFAYCKKRSGLYNGTTVKPDYVSKLIVKGTFNCAGGFGGIIETSGETGSVVLASNYGVLNKLTKIKELGNSDLLSFAAGSQLGEVEQDKQAPQMYLYNGETINDYLDPVAASTYIPKEVNGKSGWYAEKINISYDLNGGSGTAPASKTELDSKTGYILSDADLPDKDIDFSRTHYTFGGWYTDPSCDEKYKATIGKSLFCSTTLYAKWIPVPYEIEFYDKYDSSIGTYTGDSNAARGEIESTFTCTTYDSFPGNIEHSSNYVLRGYYLDEECTKEVLMIDGKLFVYGEKNGETEMIYLVDGKVKIYLLWYSENTKFYHVTYINEKNTEDYDNAKSPSLVTLSYENNQWSNSIKKFDDADNDSNYKYYFEGWYLSEDYTGDPISEFDTELFTNYRLDLYAKWSQKISVTYNYKLYNDDEELVDQEPKVEWHKPNSPIVINYNPKIINEGKILHWTYNNTNYVPDDNKSISTDKNIVFIGSVAYKVTYSGLNSKVTIGVPSGTWVLAGSSVNVTISSSLIFTVKAKVKDYNNKEIYSLESQRRAETKGSFRITNSSVTIST